MNNMRTTSAVRYRYSLLTTRYSLLVLLLCCSLFSLQCKKDLVTTSPSAKLSFSTNLLFFDTVFVTQGSSSRIFVVHNNNNEAIVTSIRLQGSYTSPFEINVDGVAGINFNNVKIPANDSIYIFTQVNIDPLNVNNPALVKDSLVFTTNGNVQWVDLQAFGWNAHFFMPNMFPKYQHSYCLLSPNPGVVEWKNDKPYVIFGYLINGVPGCTLKIDAGAQVFFHDSALLYIDSGTTLDVTGNAEHPVTFQGDRLEPAYKNLPGQWGEILLYESLHSNISWAVIQNGTTGIQVDTIAPGSSSSALTMDHTIIKTMSSYGLLCEGAPVEANNCLIADCQYSCVFLYIGGSYTFNQCTFADYWGVDNSYGQRATPLLYMNNYYQSSAGQPEPRGLSALFNNCIIYGALSEEIGLDSNYGAAFRYYFENSILSTKHSLGADHYNMIYEGDPLFTDISADNYFVNPGSPALGKSTPGDAYRLSLDNKRRPADGATIGTYEQ